MELCALAGGTLGELGVLHRAVDDTAPLASQDAGAAAASQEVETSAAAAEGIEAAGELAAAAFEAEGWTEAAGNANAIGTAVPAVPPTPASATAPGVVASQGPLDAAAVPGAPEGWSKTPSGYVFNKEHRKVGRLTAWGKNFSMKCDYHRSCSLAKSKNLATEGQLLAWLQLGAPAEGRPAITTFAAHKALWSQVAASSSAAAPASSSSA